MTLYICLALFIVLVNDVYSKTVFDNNFIKIRNEPTFVDKTMLIQEFLKHKYLFINAPDKFGKTTNLDMTSLFLGNHRSKQEIENSFVLTKIWNEKDFVKQHLGEYPVIHFNLKLGGFASDFEQTLTAFKVSLYNAFSDHLYLFDSRRINKDQKVTLKTYTDLTNCRLMDAEMVAVGLRFLAQVLHQHHGKPVILLADEFGRGITEGILKNHVDLPSIVELYSSILNNTFSNESIISHALLSGENWLYGVQSPAIAKLVPVAFLRRMEFSTFYGFTNQEVLELMNKLNVSNNLSATVLKWYGGYASPDGLFQICNPFSTFQYLNHKKDLVYWTGSALAPDLIRNMVEVESLKKRIISLSIGDSVEVDLNNNIEDATFLGNKVEQLPQYCENFFLRVLLETGYLTFVDSKEQFKTSLKVPNEEVKSSIVQFSM